MINKWISWFNYILFATVALLIGLAAALHFQREELLEQPPTLKEPVKLPKNLFEQPLPQYSRLNPDLLKLEYTSPTLQLPNLRNVILYFGQNSRLDAAKENNALHIGVQGNNEITSANAGQPIYLNVEETAAGPKYHFSKKNAPTPLWIEIEPLPGQASIQVFLRDPNGLVLRKPQTNAQFYQPEKEFSRYGTGWEIGKTRVDGTLLARQRARWYGQDRFLDAHGGKEYSYALNKQRIDFGEGDDSYAVFIDTGSCLIWKDNRWQMAIPGSATRDYPLMCVKKIDPRLINLELWDVNGRGKAILNILKSIDTPAPKTLLRSLKFIGARTLSQFLFEINGERVTLKPKDWLLFRDNRWFILKDPREISRYVDRKVSAPLFVFEGVVRRDDKQVMKGVLYNTNRTEVLPIEMPLTQVPQGSSPTVSSDKNAKPNNTSPPPVAPRHITPQDSARTVLDAMHKNNDDHESDDIDEDDDDDDDDDDESQ